MDGGTQVDDAAKVKSSMDYLVLNKKAKMEPVVAEKAKVDKEDYDDELARALEEARTVELQAREVEREVAVRRMALLHAVGRVAELRQRLHLAQRAVAHREALLVAIYDHVLAAAERKGEHEAKKNESDTEGCEHEVDGNGEGKAKEAEADDDEPSEKEKTPTSESAEDHSRAAITPRDEPTTPPTQGVAEQPQAEGQEGSASLVGQDSPAASSPTNAEADDGISDPTVEMAMQAHETEPQPPHAEAIDQTTTTTTETRETEPCEALAPPELLARPIEDKDGDGEASIQEPAAQAEAEEPTSETAEEGEEEARSGQRSEENSDEASTTVVVGEDHVEEEEEVDEDEEGVLSPPSDDEDEEVEEDGVGRRQESLDAEEEQKEERAKLLRGLRGDQPQHEEEEEEEEEEEAEKSENEDTAVESAEQKNENDEGDGSEVTTDQARKNEAVTTHEETENCVVVSCTTTMEAQAKESNDDRWHLSRLDDTEDMNDESEKDTAEHTNKEDEFTIDAQELLAFIVTKYSELDQPRASREEKNESEEAEESEEDEELCVSPMPLLSSRSLVAPDGPPRSLVDVVWSERSHGETKAPAERKAVSERKPPSARGPLAKRPKAKTAIKAKTMERTKGEETTTRTEDEEEASIRALKAQWLEERELEEAARAEESKRARELADLYHLTPRRLSATLATRSASSVDTTTRTKKVKKSEKKAMKTMTETMTESQSSTTRAQVVDELAAFEECRRDKEREREERRRARKEKKEGEEGPKATERKKTKTKKKKAKAADYSQSMSRVTGRRAAKTNKTRPESPTRPSLATPSTYAGVPAVAAPTTGEPASTQLQQLAAVSRSTPQLVSAADKTTTTTTTKKHRKKDKGKDDSEKTTKKKPAKTKKEKKDRGSEETVEPNEETKTKPKKKKKSLLRAGSRRVMKMFGGDHDDHISSTS